MELNSNIDIKPIILLVEDDPAHAMLISRSFTSQDLYQLITVKTLNEARNILSDKCPDLIITDIRLPDGKGTELLTQFQTVQNCPVIVMTSFGDETVAVKAMKSGASDYIVKSEQTFFELPTIANRVLREWRLILDKKIALDQQKRLMAIMETTPDLICIADVDGFLTYLNHSGYQMLGLNKDDKITGIRLSDFHSTEDAELIIREGIPHAIEKGVWEHETSFITKTNEVILTSQVILTHKSEQGHIEYFSSVARDIRSIRSAEEKIEYLAYYDTLTGLPNRNELLKQLNYEIAKVKRQKVHSALLFIDLDNFKNVNDSLGHPVGDKVLQEMAVRLKSVIRSVDTLARLGGDEFIVILSSLSDDPLEALTHARDVSKKLNEIIAIDIRISKVTFNLTASIGISTFSAETENAHELLRFADTAMYEAKKSGKDRYEVFHKDMGDFAFRQLELEHKLRKALSQQEFTLFYQAKIRSETGKIDGAEVLLRWNEPENSIKTPGHFIDVLESSGLIFDVDAWVLEQSIKQIATWITEGVWQQNQRLSINISARQLHNKRFTKQVENLLCHNNVPPECIDIEITEYSVMHDMKKAVVKMTELVDLGVTFSLDDFGTGYSSLSYLKSLPVSNLKIDQSFISDMTENKSDEALVTTIIAISKNLNLSVVAEGVETREQMLMLRQFQCDFLQGYYFNRPQPSNEFEQLLRENLVFM